MKYNIALVNRLREYLSKFPELSVEEKIMFRGITFMINDKMCISVSGENLMCRFDPEILRCMMKWQRKQDLNQWS